MKHSSHGVAEAVISDLYPGVLARTKLSVWGGRTLDWPFGNTAAACYYNLDVMRRAHIDNPPVTWEEVLADASAIKSSTGLPTWLFRQDQAGPIFIDTLWTYGVPWLSQDGMSTNFDNPAAAQVLGMYRQMVDDGTMLVSGTAEDDFPNGRGAMLWASSGNLVKFSQNITGFNWGITLPPRKRDAAPVTEMFGSVNTMFKSTPDQQLASWIFMAEMASTDTQSRLGADAGYFPSTRSSTSTSALQAAFSQVPQFKVAVDQIAPYMQLLPQSAALDQIRNRIATDVVTQVLLKKISPEDAARQLKMQGDQALKQAAS
jgi:ABC-type glycerol-3-phosphate transport system substrate-binding protein